MTRFEANYIKYCRVRLECSWRVVYAMHANRYFWKIPFNIKIQRNTNQYNGRELCRQAQDLLKENWEDEC